MTIEEIMCILESKGSASTKKTLLRHGAQEPLFGVRIGDLKPLQKKLRGNQQAALQLFATGNSDAMYLAGLIADGALMTKKQIQNWADSASWHMLASCSVAWVAAEHPEGLSLATKWLNSKKELIAISGWSTLSAIVSTHPDSQLPIDQLEAILGRVKSTLPKAPNRVRYAMNSFVICVGTYVAPLAEKALAVAEALGKVQVDMGDTECKVPDAASYIIKSRRGAAVAPKRKTTRC